MKIFRKISAVAFVFVYTLGLAGVAPALAAATAPDLGDAESFSVLADLNMSAALATNVSNDLGLSTGLAGSRTGPWTVGGTEYFGPLTLAATAQTDAGLANISMAAQASDGAWGPIGLTPGVYTSAASPVFAGTLTLTGGPSDVWVFQLTTDFTFTGDVVLAGGAQACNVFWQVGRDATINAGIGTGFVGTLVAGRDISLVGGVTADGRFLAGRSLTTAGVTDISGPSGACATGTIAVNKVVVNDDGGSSVIADFPLFVGGTPVSHGVATTLAPATYTVTETGNAGYTQSFSGDCDANGDVILGSGDILVCTITNDDIEQSSGGGGSSSIVPPLIDVVKVPSPLALPAGPGSVLYTFTVRNIGPVAMTNVTTVDDSCGPLTLVSGDSNTNAVLEVSETWTYTCTATLPATHTNTVTATGWANGMNAVDVAVATVVVGGPVPPLIHVTKVPNPLSLAVAGGLVTYTERITNPGPLALSNVTLTDDKCGPVVFISGDVDGDAQLDTTETWTYTCQRNLNQTTTNTATATGQANGITVTDFAIATVVVGVPGFPSTGVVPEGQGSPWNILGVGMLVLFTASLGATLRKRTV